jgi:phenylpropionate dioxygenase-like ring-hydroxylating dioxygenase large terminal subunit
VSTNPTLSADWYINSEIYAHERQSVFGDSWVHVGYDSDIPNVGDVLSESVAEVEIEIVRTQSALLVAAALLTPMNRDSILVESFRGMIFVALDTSNCPLVEWLDQFPTALVDLPLEDLVFHSRTVRRVKCNWKTYADNFLEGYHVPSVHPEMARDADAAQYSVILGDDRRWNVHVMPPRGDSVFGMFGWLYPSFAFNVVPGGWAVERWLPRGHNEIDLFFEYFFQPDAPDIDRIHAMNETVAEEDVRICEAVQRNLESGIYSEGLLSPKWEEPLLVFHDMIRELGEISGYAPTSK